ncbi:hypothetical protein GJ496_001234 [Pomphorhynchus laevis]|nr:hypothetical protein GJ496_001234 [Pomphorhynchus laevis]
MRLKSSNAKPSIIAILCNIKPVVKYRLFAAYAIIEPSTDLTQIMMFLLTLLLIIPNLTIFLINLNNGIDSVKNSRNIITNESEIQTIDKVKNLTTSTEENDELTAAETEIILNANLQLNRSGYPFEPPLVVKDTIHIPEVHFLYRKCSYSDRVFSYAMNILFLSSDEKHASLVSNSNKFESSAVFTVNVSRDYTMFCTMNLFKSNATLIVNAQNTFLEISKSVFKSYTMLIVNAKTSTIYIYKSSFHSDVNIVGNISKLVLSYCYFANNSKLTISNPMVSLRFKHMKVMPMHNIKMPLLELHLENISYINFNSKMYPNIQSIVIIVLKRYNPFMSRYKLSLENKSTLVLCNIGMQQNANISNHDNEIKQIMIVNNEDKRFNFSGYSTLENLYLHIADSSILISTSLKTVYITNEFLIANIYVLSTEAEIELRYEEYKHYYFANFKVASKLNCNPKSSQHLNVKLHCLTTLPTNWEVLDRPNAA